MTSFSCCFSCSALSYHLGETSTMGFQQAHNGGCGRGPSFTTIENQSSSSCGCWPSSTMFRTANPYFYYNNDSPQRKKTSKTTTIMCFAPSLCISFPTTAMMSNNSVLSPPSPSALLENKEMIHPVASQDCHTTLKKESNTISASETNNIPPKDHSLFGISTASSLFSFFWPFRERTRTRINDQERRTSSSDGAKRDDSSNEETKKIRIGIIGGGIAGVSVAHALTERLKMEENIQRKQKDQIPQYEIVLFEGDDGSSSSSSSNTSPNSTSTWEAATARNANTLAVAASMHIFSTRDTLWMVAKDTCREWYELLKEKVSNEPKESCPKRLFQKSPPPYFALHPWACLGPYASHDEAMAFVRFSMEFVKAALWSGKEATKLRERLHCQLAKANRIMYLNEIGSSLALKNQIGHSKGFLGTYRSIEAAQANVNDALMHGEEATLLEWNEAAKMEPHLTNIHLEAESELHKPVSLFVVQRPNDYTSSCETFIKHWTNQIKNRGVTIQHNKVKKIEKVTKRGANSDNKSSDSTSTQYQVILHEKNPQNPKQVLPFDIIVLACGINTPLVAASLGFGHLCPTYPLRGFSLTIHVDPKDEDEESSTRGDNATSSSSKSRNLLCQPFSLDNIYCTSVGPNMARLAGFGEFVGFRSPYTETIPSIGPNVLHRYAHMYFPSLEHNGHAHAIAKSCFRPLSPDDLPLIGSIQDAPGVFLHTGHGTFGWTTGLQTGDCVAQDIVHYLTKHKQQQQTIDKDEDQVNKDHHEKPTGAEASLYYDLADGSRISKASVSPNRFA